MTHNDVRDDGYIPTSRNEHNMLEAAMMGDAVIRVWLYRRIGQDFKHDCTSTALGKLCSNAEMIRFARDSFPTCQGKKIADNFEAYIWHLYCTNQQKMNDVMWQFYASFFKTYKKSNWLVCPLMWVLL